MDALYDTQADAVSVTLAPVETGTTVHGDEIHEQAIVAVASGRPVEVQILRASDGWSLPVRIVEESYPAIDIYGLKAAIGSALAAPDHPVRVELISST